MAYSAIANSEIDTDSPITESLMTKLRDNPLAIASAATGAPAVTSLAISTTSATAGSQTVTGTDGTANWVPPAGQYMFYATGNAISFQVKNSVGTWVGGSLTTGKAFAGICDGSNVRFLNPFATGNNATVYWRRFSN